MRKVNEITLDLVLKKYERVAFFEIIGTKAAVLCYSFFKRGLQDLEGIENIEGPDIKLIRTRELYLYIRKRRGL